MAIYVLQAKILGRENRGRSAVASAAYQAGAKLYDELKQKVHDYSRRIKGVVASLIVAPDNAPGFCKNPEQLWNAVERSEKRCDAQLARQFVLALPAELDKEAQYNLVVDWAKKELVSKGMVVQVSIHEPKEGKNIHAHLLCTMRRIEGEQFSAKKPREWNDKKLLLEQRESWANAVNAALEKAGHSERVSHRSLKEQGIDRDPQPKIGVAATAMKKRGVLLDPERFKLVRFVKIMNEIKPLVRAIRKSGEVPQMGMGKTWWEKSITFMSRIREKSRSTWRKFISVQRSKPTEPDMER